MSMQSLNMRGGMIILAVLIAAYSVPTLSVAVPQSLNVPAKVPSGPKESVTVSQGLISSLKVLRDVKTPTIVLQKPSTAVNVPPKTAKSVAEPQGHQHASVRVLREIKASVTHPSKTKTTAKVPTGTNQTSSITHGPSVRVLRETKASVTDPSKPNTPAKVPTGTYQTSSITHGTSGRVLRETKASVAAPHENRKLVKVPLSKAETVIHESNIPVRMPRGTNESIIVLLKTNKTTTQGNKTSVRVLRDTKVSTVSDKPNIPAKESHGPVIPINIDRDTNDSIAVRLETNKTFTVPQGNTISVRVLRETKQRVSVPNKPNRPVKVSHGPNTPIRIPRETNQSATEKPNMPLRKVRDINKSTTNLHGSADVTTTVPKTTRPKLGNMIMVPDNCPEGKKFVNGACREIWEPSR